MKNENTTKYDMPANRREAREAIDLAIGGLEVGGIDLIAQDAASLLRSVDGSEYASPALRELARLLEVYEALPVDGEEDGDDEASFIDPGPFPNKGPEFAEMTPEDEVSIRGEAA